ncbi:3-oxoacyl-ACP synthase III family protein [Stappia indica]|uniref:3-oxoacyl-[acyl-carrier-protein] synthase-3 n=1 Tax=Stappia indica TaxID=538381 RepID=A0A285RPH4_9HYPH|nr:3-oxoacyl-[acyl-carrier-protein] synthase III C-terminal domain-containing protein [Stappia indica]SOB95784.1 3-oxoacyl-[acyl-carrier-protein] synthase-3 [Stappia indica]
MTRESARESVREPVGLLAAAHYLPERTSTLDEIIARETGPVDVTAAARLGVDSVHVFEGESPTDMAVAVSRKVLETAGLTPLDLDAIIDFSMMPQRYVEPAWSMSNELQAELGAKRAFTLGYSGGHSSNLHAAIKFARALILANDDVHRVLLVASDQAISGNRVIAGQDSPLTVLGDGASAVIVARGAGRARILGTAMRSTGALHDVLNIPGGGMKHPTRLDLYRLTLDAAKHARADRTNELKGLVDKLLARHGLSGSDIGRTITANISASDAQAVGDSLGAGERLVPSGFASRGHLHASDLVLNMLELEEEAPPAGTNVLLATHGHGFLYGATLLQY